MARRTRLNVYRTPIGFHDAYVAAPSQKAALEAWGTDVNLFARGSAELVVDEELAREPLERPGEVIRRLRGSADEHMAALPPDRPRPKPKPAAKAKAKAKGEGKSRGEPTATASKADAHRAEPKRPPPPRPSRRSLDAAEKDLADLVERQRRQDDDLRDRERALREERDALARSHARELAVAERLVERERTKHSKALARWSDARS